MNEKKLSIIRKTLNIDGWSSDRTKVNNGYYFSVFDENDKKLMARNMILPTRTIIIKNNFFKYVKHTFTNGNNEDTADIFRAILKEDFNLTNVNPEPNQFL